MKKEEVANKREENFSEILGTLFLAVTALVFMSLITYEPTDSAYLVSTPNQPLANFIGIIGAYLAGALVFLMGFASFVIPALTLFWAIAKFLKHKPQKFIFKFAGSAVLFFSASGFFSMVAGGQETRAFQSGGIIGFAVSNFMVRYFGNIGSLVIISSLLLLSVLLATDFLIIPFIKHLFKGIVLLLNKSKKLFERRKIVFKIGRKEKPGPLQAAKKTEPRIGVKQGPRLRPKAPIEKPRVIPTETPASEKPAEVKVSKPKSTPWPEYKFPTLDFLNSPPPIEERKIEGDLKQNSEILEETLKDFGIEAKVVRVNKGPVITRYELQPAAGVKVNKITALSDDIALAMKAQSVRIVAPVPGKGTVGIEVPNTESSIVYLKDILESKEFKQSKSKIKLGLGKSISGRSVITDLADMPHLLIAGTTGSGKTVCMNCLIMSLLFNASPDELKFLMVDPKMVELAAFNGLPHLISPVVTEPKKVSNALNWVVNEMENRYKVFAEAGVRNITMYNKKIKTEKVNQEHGLMPYIVVIIDELADLMLVAQTDIESAITRLAQLSRAVGIHIILATQRPSVDVITGVIKANFPARISFKVATKVDSRTVLDMNGADKLLGKGDMLFLEPGTEKPIRAQGTLVSDSEIERVTNFIKAQREPEYNEEILRIQKKQTFKVFEKDEVYDEAVRLILNNKQASVSMLQRKLGLGYTRAARLIDMMEENGIVGPYQGSKPRDILIENIDQVKEEDQRA